MSDGSLSQEEIDALLQGVDDVAPDAGAAPAGGAPASNAGGLNDTEINAFKGVINEQLDSASNTLTTIVTKKVDITDINIEVKSQADVRSEIADEYLQVKIDFTEGMTGDVLFLLKKMDGAVIADLMMGQDGTAPPADLNDLYLSALGEAISQINGAGLNIISNKLNKIIKTSTPKVEIFSDPSKMLLPAGDQVVKVSSTYTIEGLISSTMVQIYPLNLVKEVVAGDMPAPAAAAGPSQVSYEMNQPMAAEAAPAAPAANAVNVQQVQFPGLSTQNVPTAEQNSNIQLLMDVPMQLTVELGRTRMLVKEILSLGEGSIIELDKLAGEPVDLLVNNKLVAKGEVVVIDENFGVRVTDIINPMDRIMGLQEK